MRLTITLFCLLAFFSCIAQTPDSARQKYLTELRAVGKSFAAWFYPERDKLYALPEKYFISKIDSARSLFDIVLAKYTLESAENDSGFITVQQNEIHYFFDKFILDYPYFNELRTGKKVKLSAAVQKRLDKNRSDFNKPDLLTNTDFIEYVNGFLHEKSNIELKKAKYKKMDNQRLNSVLNIIPACFTNSACREFWQYRYINEHIEDWGVKNMDRIVSSFNARSKDTSYTNKINTAYTTAMKDRAGHLIKTYKSPGGFALDLHLFLPDSLKEGKKRPVMVYFSGGSWTKGNPEWAFYNCENYAKKGWIGVSVEYRLADRHGTTPFESVMDARSAIRWLRQHADEYHIDTNRIVGAGNSAGAHLVLTTVLADKLNEKTDDLRYNPSVNLLLISSGVYDFMTDANTSWVAKHLKDKSMVREISPVHLVRKGLPPMLILHGTNDQSVPYNTAELFNEEMKKLGNDIEFHKLEGGPHAIWFDRRFSRTVSALRNEYLKKHGYE